MWDDEGYERQQEERNAAENAKHRKKQLEAAGNSATIKQSNDDTRKWDISVTTSQSRYGEKDTTVTGGAEGADYAKLLEGMKTNASVAEAAADFRNDAYKQYRKKYLEGSKTTLGGDFGRHDGNSSSMVLG